MTFLAIGLVMGVGTDKDAVVPKLKNNLRNFGYEYIEVKVTDLIKEIYLKKFSNKNVPNSLDSAEVSKDEFDRLYFFMEAGDKIRNELSSDFLALAIISFVNAKIDKKKKQAFIITNLKHPDEVKLLRAVYGNAFYLIGLHSNIAKRKRYLLIEKNIQKVYREESDKKIVELFEKEDAGQKSQSINKTFHLADYFIQHDEDGDKLQFQICRFLKILHGYPFETPTKDEHFMFMAYTTSLRSSDLSRQVGAVLVSKDGELISTGANEVPKIGGGLFWSDTGEGDERDWVKREDKNAILKNETILKVLKSFKPEVNVDTEKDRTEALKLAKNVLGENLLFEMTEYNRAVHAEMEALLACARISGNSKGGRLYSTTFPCHNCAKHIIAAGIMSVIYVEPYTKSKATYLYESLSLDASDGLDSSPKIVLQPFIGMGPRRYFDLFSMSLGSGKPLQRKDDYGRICEWKEIDAELRLPLNEELINSGVIESLEKFTELIESK